MIRCGKLAWHHPPLYRRVAVYDPRSRSRALSSSTASSDAVPLPSGVLYHQWIRRDKVDASSNPVVFVFLHGLFGQGMNLKRLAQKLCQRYLAAGLLIDLPGHGKSSSSSAVPLNDRPITVADCATAVGTTLRHCLTEAETPRLFGHSLGGRVAVHYALQSLHINEGVSPPRPDHVWLLDTVPDVPDPTTRQVLALVQYLLERQGGDWRTTRAGVRDHFYNADFSQALVEWLAMQWNETEGHFLFDATVVEQLLNDITQAETEEGASSSLWKDMETVVAAAQIPLHLVRAGMNMAWTRERRQRLQALQERQHPMFTHHVLPNAGHWVHVDDLHGLVDLIASVHDVKDNTRNSKA